MAAAGNSAMTRPVAEADAAAEHPAGPGRRLVLLDDLDLAAVLALDDGGVVGVDQVRLGVEVLDRVVVGHRVIDVAVDADVRRGRCQLPYRQGPPWCCRGHHPAGVTGPADPTGAP